MPCYDKKDTTAQPWPCLSYPEPKALIDSTDYTIEYFAWSPDGTQIAFSHQPDPLINSFFDSDISLLDVKSGKVVPLVSNPSADDLAGWSPDGKFVLYTSSEADRVSNYYQNNKVFKIPVDGGRPVPHFHRYSSWFAAAVWDRHLVRDDPPVPARAAVAAARPARAKVGRRRDRRVHLSDN